MKDGVLATKRKEQRKDYEIVSLTPATNAKAALQETARYMVSLSGGLGSAIAGARAIARHGRDQVGFWFADTRDEDPDLYRFLEDLMAFFGGKLYWYTDGRRPEDVWEKHKIIPNNRIAPCSYTLKVLPFRKFIQSMPLLPVVYIGYKNTKREQKRGCRTAASYAKAIPAAIVDYPLFWEPAETRPLAEVCCEELGIDPPRLYELGFDYNNCGGGCCRSGIESWVREAYYFPDRFEKRMLWEEKMRALGGATANRAFCARQVKGRKHPLPLRQIQEDYLPHAKSILHLPEERPV